MKIERRPAYPPITATVLSEPAVADVAAVDCETLLPAPTAAVEADGVGRGDTSERPEGAQELAVMAPTETVTVPMGHAKHDVAPCEG